jgi:hypothetical protein
MPAGLDFDKPTVSIDALEARVPIAPQGAAVSPLDELAVKGFGILKH